MNNPWYGAFIIVPGDIELLDGLFVFEEDAIKHTLFYPGETIRELSVDEALAWIKRTDDFYGSGRGNDEAA